MSPNPANLPSDFIKRAKALLLPHVQREDDRDALLIEAFYIRDRALRFEIELGGNANTFTVRCIERLLERNCFGDKSHPLSTLLRAIPCGAEGEAEAEAESLSHLLDAGCADSSSSSPATTPAPTPPPDPITIVNNLTNVTINTGGGAYIEGDVQTGGDFVGRDQIRLATQSVELPAARRTPTVFICYSRADATVANRVVADLQTAGHACWLDASDINRGDEWVRSISEGINNSYAVVVLCSRASLQSRWVKNEILWAQQKGKRIYPVLLEDVTRDDDFFSLVSYQALSLQADYAAGMGALITALPKVEVLTPKSVTESAQVTPAITRRALELEYLDRLRFEELLNTDKYTPLAGSTSSATTIDLGAVVMRQEFEHIRWHAAMRETQPPRKFSNVIEELLTIKRAAVLGEPGAGKSTTLWKLARHLVDAAIDDMRQPIPLLIRLGKWTDPTQPLPEFIASVLGELGAHMPDLMREGRAALLLDGLNEIPVNQRDDKTAQVRDFLKAKPQHDLIAVVTCREQDYSQDLRLDRVAITPLDPQRILEFAQHYLDTLSNPDQGEAFRILTDAQLYLAASASFISLGDAVRFTHQLLQEYFTARHMQAEMANGRLRATDLWPPNRWWERTGWEEAAILYAGLHSDDCTLVLEWVAAANPEVAAQCIVM